MKILWAALLGVLCLGEAKALTILAEPEFQPATAAPLAGRLTLTTDTPTRVSVRINDGVDTWKRHFFEYTTGHSIILAGFKFSRTNRIEVTVHDLFGNQAEADNAITFVTPGRPVGFPVMRAKISKPDLMEPGYTLFRSVNLNRTEGTVIIVNHQGEPVWYSLNNSGSDVQMRPNGNIFTPLVGSFIEYNLLGELVSGWESPNALNVDTHDAFITDHNTILFINNSIRSYTNYPTSATNPNAPRQTTNVWYNRVVEISYNNSALLNNWSLIDVMDPYRLTYTSLTRLQNGVDTHHGNAILEDPRDGSIVVSLRNQNAVVAISRPDGRLKWILGPHENWGPAFAPYLLKPVGTPFEWNYAQHAPQITPRGTWLIYDNGNHRATPFDPPVPDSQNYSRAVEYEINEETMEVRQIWEYGKNVEEQLYTGSVGAARWMPKMGNVLITFGNVSWANHQRPSSVATNAAMSRVKEVTYGENPEVVWDLELFDHQNTSTLYRGQYVYRAERIADLFPHPARAVRDLTVRMENGTTKLRFSADPFRSYTIESTTNFQEWDSTPAPGFNDDAVCEFAEPTLAEEGPRFYRVVTH